MPHPYENIPVMLKERPNWVVWGIRDAPMKAPFNPDSLLEGIPLPARAGVPETWSSFGAASACVTAGLAQGIGYEFEGNDLYGIDLDKVFDNHGALMPEAYNIVGSFNSYTEISPSGVGLHIFILAPDVNILRHRKKDFFLEIYNEGRYFTVTGNIYGDNKQIESRSTVLQSTHDKFLLPDTKWGLVKAPAPQPISAAMQDKLLHIGLKRDKVLAALWSGQRRHENESANDIALMNKLAYWCNADSDVMIKAFLSSPHYAQKGEAHKRKCQRKDYLPNTAADSSSSVFSTAYVDFERNRQGRRTERSPAR